MKVTRLDQFQSYRRLLLETGLGSMGMFAIAYNKYSVKIYEFYTDNDGDAVYDDNSPIFKTSIFTGELINIDFNNTDEVEALEARLLKYVERLLEAMFTKPLVLLKSAGHR